MNDTKPFTITMIQNPRVLISFRVQCRKTLKKNCCNTVSENIIGAPKMRNYNGAIQLIIFPILLLVKLLLLIFFASFMV